MPRLRSTLGSGGNEAVSVPVASWASRLGDDSRLEGKLAPQLARRIEEEILRLGWPVGRALGREEDLATRFGVSRSVLREALAITERDGMTRRQRGPGGGLLIAAPAEDVVSSMLGNYLSLAPVDGLHLLQAFGLLDGLMFQLAARRCRREDVSRMRELGNRELADDVDPVWTRAVQLHAGLLTMTRNPALQIFGSALAYLGLSRFQASLRGSGDADSLAFARRIVSLRRGQLESVIGGDAAAAIAANAQLGSQWLERYLATSRATADTHSLSADDALRIAARIAAVFHPEQPVKRADTLALQLQQAILGGGHRDGDRLDSEAVLLQRYGVSRGVLREAVRYLERNGVLRTEEGRNGGVCVAAADSTAAARSAVLLLRFLDMRVDGLLEFSQDLELAAATAAVQRSRQHGADVLIPFITAIDAQPDTADVQGHMQRLYEGLAAASGNPIFIVFVQILGGLLRVDSRSTTAALVAEYTNRYRDYLSQMRLVARAMQDGDDSLARRELLLARRIGGLLRPHARPPSDLLEQLL
ncbi:MAG: GntR family transcriptional regulator [Hydrocarboniphaga sp.]|nr:GntR family transcriptional regulator [Hydrocarboniphaga sp.]